MSSLYPIQDVSITFSAINPFFKKKKKKSDDSVQYKFKFQPSSPHPTLWCELDWLDKDVHWAPRNLPSTSTVA